MAIASTNETVLPSYTETENANTNNSSQYTTRSWYFGKYILANPQFANVCSLNSAITTIPDTCLAPSDGKATVLNDVSKKTPYTQEVSLENIVSDGQYDAHYLLGVFYQWSTATAGSGNEQFIMPGDEAQDSVCPRGWKLPLSGADNDGTAGSFYNLLKHYIAFDSTNYQATISVKEGETGYSSNLTLVSAPLYFARSGSIRPYQSSSHFGNQGGPWSANVFSATNAYNPYFSTTYLNPSYSGSSYASRYTALPVRCVVR